ncbi:uncharacterized protein TRUGW13939_08815 [Talaromyces rugulosus]|uniref:Uncharacterized protein n=1 Tax=Talaromyces rugulosus TaxID=121627 RepID=A0A7H8RAN8_TALRU|nr:uncharacterized protein TRUGW13939_08815 [Talaromyces rugulosus]QKX61663.1 hypothetical protein TRUGW13939_08815 [Talaromyces rugulosus]
MDGTGKSSSANFTISTRNSGGILKLKFDVENYIWMECLGGREEMDLQYPQLARIGSSESVLEFYQHIRETVISLFQYDISEDGAIVAFAHANASRPRDATNEFHPNFWLPHVRLYRTVPREGKELVKGKMIMYINTYHNHPIMLDVKRSLRMF